MNDKLNEMIHELHCRFKIDYIFRQGDSKLFILFSDKEKKSLEELVNRIKKLDYPEFQTVCFFTSRVTELLENGNPALFRICQPINLVYQHPDLTETLSLPEATVCATNAQETFGREDRKIAEIRDNYYHLKQAGSNNLAAFMLHQVLALSYRHAQITLISKECISNSIREHERFLKRLYPAWEAVFQPADQQLLNVLEELYRKVRYTNDYQIAPDTLDELEQKMEKVYTQVRVILLHEFKQLAKFPNCAPVLDTLPEPIVPEPQSPQPILLSEASASKPSTELEKALSYLSEAVEGMLVVYLFGHRQNTLSMDSMIEQSARQQEFYDLLIITTTDRRDAVNQAQARLNQESNTVFLLLAFTQQQVQQALDNNTLFFHQVVQRNQTLLSSDTPEWCFHEKRGIRSEVEENGAKKAWYARELNADSFFIAATNLNEIEQARIKVVLYNLAIEQACLGLLDYYWGYRPYKYHIRHLYDLCCSFWHFPQEVFPRDTEEWKMLFKELAEMVSVIRYKGQCEVLWEYVYFYDRACSSFLEQCSNLLRTKLGTYI